MADYTQKITGYGNPYTATKVSTETLLRRIPRHASATIHADIEYDTNIGELAHRAADEIEKLKTALEQPANTVEAPKIQHILTRDQRDALCAANAFLATLQASNNSGLYHQRIQKTINIISDLLYEEN